MTHTYATLEVSPSAYDEIASKLREASYHHAFDGGALDMHGIGLVRGTTAAPDEPAVAAVIAAASEWLCEREVTDWGSAHLAKAVIRHDGDWPGCPDCDHSTCDEPCTPATVAEQLHGVDCQLAQLVHDGKLPAPVGYEPPDGWKPIEVRRKRAAPPQGAPVQQETCEMRGDADGLWWTACGADPWLFEEGGPKENRVRHCFNCGKPVRIVPHLENETEA